MKVTRSRLKLTRDGNLRHRARDQNYPYLRNGRDDPTNLLAIVNAAVPPHIPHFIRADVCQDVLLAILEGRVPSRGIGREAAMALNKVWKMHPFLFGPVSLDQVIPGTDGLRIIDTIANDREHF